MADPGARPYRGVTAGVRHAERRRRFLAAGLDLLGAEPPVELTMRVICRQAGLSPRYFYENFTDKDEFVAAVFDDVVATLAATTQAAVAAAPPAEQNRAGIANIVHSIESDPRVGRLLFSARLSNAVLLRKRAEQGGLFAMLSSEHIQSALRVAATPRIAAIAHFVVGGVGETLSAWLAGAVGLSAEDLIDQLTSTIDRLNEPRLFRA